MPLTADQALPLAILSLKAKKGRKIIGETPKPMNRLEWARAYRRIDGRPFELTNFLPLEDVYLDDHPHIVLIKPAQRGASELAINYAVFALDRGADVWTHEPNKKLGLNVGYIFPNERLLSDFSKERLSSLESESFHLEQIFNQDDGFNAVTFKQVGKDSYLYLRGGQTAAGMKSFPADVIIRDEVDEISPGAFAKAERRMNASFVRRILDLSTPTIPGRGIHALYLQSDRRIYFQTCGSCGAKITHDFFRDVKVNGKDYSVWRMWDKTALRIGKITLICPECAAVRDDAERCKRGEWVAQSPEVTSIRGYHLPWWPFPFPDMMLNLVVKSVSQDPTEITEFFQQDLGIPYDKSGVRVTEAMLQALTHELDGGLLPDELPRDTPWTWKNTSLGVDIGARLHYRVTSEGSDGAIYVRAMGSVAEFEDLDELMQRFKVRVCVVDSMPEMHSAAAFAARFPGRVALANYPTANALKSTLFNPTVEKVLETRKVQVNRTMAMDGVRAIIANCGERWPARIVNDYEVVSHMTAPVRVTTIDDTGQPKAEWVHSTPDHYYHATVYDYIARKLMTPIGAGAQSAPPQHSYHADRRRVI